MDMNAVIEVDKAGKIVDSGPLDRLVVTKTIPHRRQRRAVGPDLAMTAHTGLGRRDAGIGAVFDGGVAIAAIYLADPNMMLMDEGNWLDAGNADFSNIGRVVQGGQSGHQRDNQYDPPEDTEFG